MGAKGQPKTGGRSKGTPNKIQYGLRDKIREFAESNFDKVIEACQSFRPFSWMPTSSVNPTSKKT